VSSGTLNTTIPYHTIPYHTIGPSYSNITIWWSDALRF